MQQFCAIAEASPARKGILPQHWDQPVKVRMLKKACKHAAGRSTAEAATPSIASTQSLMLRGGCAKVGRSASPLIMISFSTWATFTDARSQYVGMVVFAAVGQMQRWQQRHPLPLLAHSIAKLCDEP